MPRKLTSRPTKSALIDLENRATKAFVELNRIYSQLSAWGGAAEKIVRWRKDINDASVKTEKVLYSMQLIIKGDEREDIGSDEYSWEE